MTRGLGVLWLLVIILTVLFGVPALLSWGFVPAPRDPLRQVALTLIGPGLLSLTVAASLIHGLHRSPWTVGTVVRAALSVGYFCAVVGALLFMATEQRKLMNLGPPTTLVPPRLRHIAQNGNPSTALQAARLAYSAFGLRLEYRLGNGSRTIYEPTLEERADRRTRFERRDEAAALVEHYGRSAEFLRATAFIYLEALPLIGTFVFLKAKRREREPS